MKFFNYTIDILSKFVQRMFACFSIMTVAMAIFGLVLKTDQLYKYMPVKNILTFLMFSAAFALSFLIADLFKKNIIIKRCVQFVLTYVSVVLVFFVGGSFGNYVDTNGIQNKGFSVLSISFAFVIIYAACALIAVVAGVINKVINNSDEDYTNVYKTDSDKVKK